VLGNTKAHRHYSLSDLCQVYSLLLQTPTKSLVEGLVNGDLFSDLYDILIELGLDQTIDEGSFASAGAYCSQQTPEDLLHEMRVEYTRLFIKTSKAPEVPIYEALFMCDTKRTGFQPLLFVSQEAMGLMELYKKIGLIRSSEFNNSEDHFAFQFIFLSKIHQLLAVAGEEYAQLDELLKDYMSSHFKKWAIGFFALCEEKTDVDTYRLFWRIGRIISEELLMK